MACDSLCLCMFKCHLVRGKPLAIGGGSRLQCHKRLTSARPSARPSTAFRSGVEEHFAIELHYRANQYHLMLDHSLGGTYAFMEWQGEQIYYQ